MGKVFLEELVIELGTGKFWRWSWERALQLVWWHRPIILPLRELRQS